MADQDLRKQRQTTVRHVECETLFDQFTPDNTTGEKSLFDVPKGTRVVDAAIIPNTPSTGTTHTASLILDDGSNQNLITNADLKATTVTRLDGTGNKLASAAAQIKLNVTVATAVTAGTFGVMVVVKRESAI